MLIAALADEEPLVRGHAAWALGRIGTVEAKEAPAARAGVEAERWVQEEIVSALSRVPAGESAGIIARWVGAGK